LGAGASMREARFDPLWSAAHTIAENERTLQAMDALRPVFVTANVLAHPGRPQGMETPMNKRTLFKFRLYTADHTMNSTEALANLTALCALHLPDRHEIEVVNVLLNPRRALADQIRMTPTLLKLSPSPVQRITGTLSQTPLLLAALGLQTAPA
jgi:circadian clock protein KaiB